MARSKQGSIVRRGKRLYARIRWTEWDGGQRVKREKFVRVRTISEGREKIRQLLHEMDKDGTRIFDADRLTFEALGAAYAREVIQPAEYTGNQKVAGLRNTKSPTNQLKACVEFFGQRLVKSIDYGDLVYFKRRRSMRVTRRGAQPSIVTVHRELERLRAVFRFAIRKRWLRHSPFEFGPPLINKADEPIRERIPNEQEVEAILAQCRGKREHLRAILITMRDTGMRPSELFRVKVEDVYFDTLTIEVRVENSKTGRRRYTGLTPDVAAELLELIERNYLEPGDLLFGIRDNVRRAYSTACRLAGVQGVNLYAWRHLCATEMMRAGVPQTFAMKTMGHSEEKTFRRYVTVDQDIASQTAAALHEYRKQKSKK